MGHLREPLPTDVMALPPLPPGYDAVLETGLAALDLRLPAATRERIADHVRLLVAWNAAINLTAIRDPVAVAREHVLDSLAAVALLRDRRVRAILDLGAGGGFPGLPLALVLEVERLLLVESVGKKARFLGTVVDALGLRPWAAVAATRAETLAADPHHRARWPAVVVRAVGSLAEVAELALPLLEPGGVLVAWKRRGAALEGELASAGGALAELGGSAVSVHAVAVDGLEDHILAVVDKVRATPSRYPRDPAERRRRPW